MDNFDVIAIGGGPSGCAAAITCARSGLKVALVEGSVFPRPRPGETLHPGVEPILHQLGVWEAVRGAGFLRHQGHEVEWFAPRRFEAFGSDRSGIWQGFQAWRADFDSILLDRAIALGVKVIQPCRVLRPLSIGDRTIGVESDRGEIAARFTIDATGNYGCLGRHLPLEMQYFTPRLIARYGYVRGECGERERHPLIVADADGWTWTARVRPHLYQWTRLNLTGARIAKEWLPAEFNGLAAFGNVRSADVTWRMLKQTAGRGFFIIGDAAAVLDPASSHGVLKAMMSGMMAAHLIIKSSASASERVEASCVNAYRRWLQSWYLQDIDRLRDLYSYWMPIV